MEFLKFSLSGFDDFLLHFGLAIGFVVAFLWVYMLVTPYNELQLIRAGNASAAWSLGFAMLGFSLPLPIGVVGHEGSTVLFCLNGLRLLSFMPAD